MTATMNPETLAELLNPESLVKKIARVNGKHPGRKNYAEMDEVERFRLELEAALHAAVEEFGVIPNVEKTAAAWVKEYSKMAMMYGDGYMIFYGERQKFKLGLLNEGMELHWSPVIAIGADFETVDDLGEELDEDDFDDEGTNVSLN